MESYNHEFQFSVITVNFHTDHLLAGLHASLKMQNQASELIIIDNSSTLSQNFLEPTADHPIRIVSPGTNVGYAAAVNLALDLVRCRWVLLLNPDARLCPNALYQLHRAAVTTRTPLCGPRFYWDDQKRFRMPPAPGDHPSLAVAFDSAPINRIEASLLDHTWQIRHHHFWQQVRPFPEPFLSGACLLLDLDWFKERGEAVFDEDFFLYYEDTDLCLRLIRQGVFPQVVPGAEAIHYFDQSPSPSTQKNELLRQSRVLFYHKHFNKLPPPLPLEQEPLPHFPDLEASGMPPTFPVDPPVKSACLELALNPWFVPFIQTPITAPGLTLPQPIWQRLAPGHYFTRVREPMGGVISRWTWTKD